MVDCSPAAKKSKPRKRVPHLIAVSKGFIPDGRYPDETARFASKLMQMTSMRKDRIDGEYIPFGQSHFRAMFGGSKASKIKGATERSRAIKWRHTSRVGEYPESVKLTDEYRTGEFELHEIKMKVRRQSAANDDNLMRLGPVGMALTARLDLIRIDPSAVPNSAWEHYQIERIRQGDIYSTRCDYRRFHSNFTSLSKTLRQSLRTTTNDKLTAIDIANSQPLILGLVSQTPSIPIPLCGTLSAYLDVTQKGEIYEYAAARLTETTGRKWEARPETKDLFMPFLFDRVCRMKSNPLWQVFRDDFVAVLDCILDIKRERYQALAHRLQSLEAEIMIDGVSAEFMRRYPHSPILTVHDEIIVPVQYRDEVCDIIRAEFGKYAVTPTIK